ncbi:MAG: hypothetical protein IJ887_04070 [Prevotella sp.]|nr:hypothetical protein [Prevotella sp.]
MNQHKEVPDFLGGLGDMLPADVLKKVNELLEQLHRADKDHQGSPVFIYAPGSQYVDKQFNIGAYPQPHKPHPLTPSPKGEGGVDSAEASKSLPEVLATDEAMALWRKAQQAGYVDEHYQPLLSRTQAALLADAMAERLGIKEKWKVYGDLWKRNNMRGDYTRAMNQRQSLDFQDKLKRLFSTDIEENTGKT